MLGPDAGRDRAVHLVPGQQDPRGSGHLPKAFDGHRPNLLSLRGHTDSVENLAYGPDSRTLVSASTDGTARVWRPGTPGAPVVLRGEGSGTVETVAVSPDGYRVAAGGSDGTVRVFNVGGQDDPLVLPGHDGTVWGVAFSPDGRRLASSGADGGLRVWQVDRSALLVALTGFGSPVEQAVFGPGGDWIATVHDDGTLRLARSDRSDRNGPARTGSGHGVWSPTVSRSGATPPAAA